MYIKDLDRCTYFGVDCDAVIAVGWLARGHEFTQGAVEPAFFERVTTLAESPWEPVVFAGCHECDLCQFPAARFSENLFVPDDGRLFAAPVAITHYITAHWYRPPAEFVRAVLKCPEMSSMEYKKAVLANGGREFLQALKERQADVAPDSC